MIDTKALAERIHKAINWPGDETLSELLDDELRPLLAELANIRGELLAAKTARDLAVTVERAKAYDDGFKAGMAASTATAMPASEGKNMPELDMDPGATSPMPDQRLHTEADWDRESWSAPSFSAPDARIVLVGAVDQQRRAHGCVGGGRRVAPAVVLAADDIERPFAGAVQLGAGGVSIGLTSAPTHDDKSQDQEQLHGMSEVAEHSSSI